VEGKENKGKNPSGNVGNYIYCETCIHQQYIFIRKKLSDVKNHVLDIEKI